MTSEEWQRVRPVLESALELDAASRSGYLDGVCTDAVLRGEIESLIAAHEQAGTGVLGSSAVPTFAFEEEARFRLLPGRRIGVYEILDEIAQGGMGAVYRAIRADGQYQQRVALKIVRSELGAESTATRFRNERQILASLDHPNIAKILDGSTTADGLPYFVMEFIDGLPITDYCDQRKLSVDARLNIFRTVCSAVHYAHQHLVIHRDLKPSNILISPEGVPKLLDFGISKILNPNLLPENATLTVGGQWLMTPEYASPEQLRGEAVTTAADVYSLGLVLYELLTGHRAYRFLSHMPHEIVRAVLETEPEKPSTAIRHLEHAGDGKPEKPRSTPEPISGPHCDSSERLRKRLTGDLDNIVMKAIRKEPGARYASVDQLSEDIRRHLDGMPVLARKSTLAYRCRKYVLRQKVGVTAAAVVFLSLLSGIGLTLREARIARANEFRAERRFNDVRKLANSLVFEVHDSIRDLPGATSARKLIVQRAQEYLDSLAQESTSDPALLQELAGAYGRLASVQGDARDVNLGDTSSAVQSRRKATQLLETAASIQPSNKILRRELAESYLALGVALSSTGDRTGVVQQKAIQILEPLAAASPHDQTIQLALAKAYEMMAFNHQGHNDLPRALEYFHKADLIEERLAEADPQNQRFQREIAFSHKHLGGNLMLQNRLPEALDQYRSALLIDEAQLARNPHNVPDRYNITFTYNDMGMILRKQGDPDAALNYHHKALDIRAALFAADPKDDRTRQGLSNSLSYIGDDLLQKRDYRSALEYYKKALAIRQDLSQKDPANEKLRFLRSLSQSEVGIVSAEMALRTNVAPAGQVKYCREAMKWLEPSWPTWLERKAEGKLGEDEEAYTQAAQDMRDCSRVLEHTNTTPQ